MRRWSQLSLVWRFAIVSLVVVALVGFVLARILGNVVTRHSVQWLGSEARDTLSARVLGQLSPEDLRQPMRGERYADFQRFVDESVVSARTARIRIWNRDGTVIYSDDTTQVGKLYPPRAQLERALQGETVSELSSLEAPENEGQRAFDRLLEVYTPIRFPGSSEAVGALEIYQYYEPVAGQIAEIKRYLYLGLTGGLAFLYLALFAVFKGGENLIRRQRTGLERYAQDLEDSRQQTLLAVAGALDLRDAETQHHSERVQQMALAVGRQVPLSAEEDAVLATAALLHDVGKIGVPDHILRKPGPLSRQEWEAMKKHPELGYRLLKDFEFLRPAAEIVYTHHERFDGSGYPRGLAGQDIPLCARVFAVADAYEAMTSHRPYRRALSHWEAVEEIRRNAGTQFDPQVVEALLRAIEEEPRAFSKQAPEMQLARAA